MKKIISIAFAIACLYSCEEPIQQDTLAELYVRYEADVKQLKGEGSFYEYNNGVKGESKVFTRGVQFINSGMRTTDLNDGLVRYYGGIGGLLPKETYFTWYGEGAKANTVYAPITKINGYEIEKDTISLKDGLGIYLNTSNLEKTDKLVLAITDAKGKAKNLETKGPTTTTKFKIPGRELKGLSPGEAQIYVVRSYSDELNEETYKAVINAEYYSKPKKIEIVE